MLDLHTANREFLAPFDPVRDDDFFTLEVHRARIAEAGRHSWLILDDGEPAGFIGLSNVVRGPLQSAILSYWVDQDHNGRGLATRAVASRRRLRVRRPRAPPGRSRNAAGQLRLAARSREERVRALRPCATLPADRGRVARPRALRAHRRVNFARSVHEIAPELVGSELYVDGVGGVIVEVEAYDHEDPAAHGFRGRTERNADDVRPARSRIRLPLLRNPLVPQLRLRGGGSRKRRADPRARAARRPRRDERTPRRRRRPACSAPDPAASARRSASPASTTGCHSTNLRSSSGRERARSSSSSARGSGSRRRSNCRGATGLPARPS